MKDPSYISFFELIQGVVLSLCGAIVGAYHNLKSRPINSFLDIFLYFVSFLYYISQAAIVGIIVFLFCLEVDFIDKKYAIYFAAGAAAVSGDIYIKLRKFIHGYKFNKKDSE